jgi:hypothetical protein
MSFKINYLEKATVRCLSNFAEFYSPIDRTSCKGVQELLCFLQSFWTIAPRLRGQLRILPEGL